MAEQGIGATFAPLRGIRVLEWSSGAAGPFAGKVLAALGADVVKVEHPDLGDEDRRTDVAPGDSENRRSGFFLYVNHGKRSVTADPTVDDGCAVIRALALHWADVFIEDQSPVAVRELGLDYESLSTARADLIMASITPFGQSDHSDRKVYPSQTSYSSGAAYLQPTGFLYEDSLNKAPVRLPGYIPEYSAGLHVALAILTAVWYRKATGLGQHIDISKQETQLHGIRTEIDSYPNEGVTRSRQSVMPKPYENVPGGSMSGTMPCKDGFVTTWLLEPYMPTNLASWLGNPAWSQNEHFLRAVPNDPMMTVFRGKIVEEFQKCSKEELYLGLQAARVAVAPINTPPEVLEAPQLEQRQFFENIDFAGRSVKIPRLPFQIQAQSVQLPGRASSLGEHNEEMLCDVLGYSKSDLARLRAMGAI